MGKIYAGSYLGTAQKVTNGATQVLSVGTTRVASSFAAEDTSMLGIWTTFTAASGSPTIRFSIRAAAANGFPSTTEVAYTEQTISSSGWKWIALSASGLVVGNMYWVVAYYISGSTSATIAFNSHLPSGFSTLAIGGIQTYRTTDSESTWPTSNAQVSFSIVKFSATHFQSIVPSYNGWMSTTVMKCYTGQEAGFEMITPKGSVHNIRGLSFDVRRAGTATGSVTHKLYVNKCLCAQKTASWDASAVASFLGNALVLFDSPVYVPEASTITATHTFSGGNSTTDYLYANNYMTTAVSFPSELLPQLRSVIPASVSFNGTTWSYDTGNNTGGGALCAFLFDGEYPFGQPSINRRQFNNQR